MASLHQIVAVVAGKKTRAQQTITGLYKSLQKSDLFSGIARKYEPSTEDGERYPAESKNVQLKTLELIKQFGDTTADLWDTVATQDEGNMSARADVVVDGVVVAKQLPVATLLYLEKQLNDVATFVGTLPTLDPAEQWTFSPNSDCFVSAESRTAKTKKVPRNHVKAEATDKHPAQVELYYEDVKVGEWSTLKYSGAVDTKSKNVLLAKVEKLRDAVKEARAVANQQEVKQVAIGKGIFQWLMDN